MAVDVAGLPLYRRIAQDLRDRMARGELPPGGQVETELELMARYGVSRATVRQALGSLISAGLLEVRRGLGTFVRPRALEHALGGFYTFSREIERHGMAPGHACWTSGWRPRMSMSPVSSGWPSGSRWWHSVRIRLADDDPLVSETSYLPAARFPGLEDIDFGRVKLYETLTSRYGVRPVRAREVFQPVLLSKATAALLDREPGDPALRVDRTAYDAEGSIVEYCQSTVRGDRYRYSVELRES